VCVCVCVSYDCQNNQRFFRRVCKIAKSDYSSCPSVRSPTLELGFHGADFLEIWYLRIFRKSVEKIQVSLISDKNKGYFTWRPMNIFGHISLSSFLEWEMFQRKAVEKIKTRILCSVNFFSPKIVPLWDNVEKYCRAGQATHDNMPHDMLDT